MKKVIAKKQLLKDVPELLAEWDFEKNSVLQLNINELFCGSSKKVWWKCKLGHSWEARIADRAKGSGCPYCSNKKIMAGINDLKTTNPKLAKEWNYDKNVDIPIESVAENSMKKVWWKCDKGHEWEAAIVSRNRGSKCPICANRKLLQGYNDLETCFPDIAAEWHPVMNNGLLPNQVLCGTNDTAWWKCKYGHEWKCQVVSRTKRGSGCPVCSSAKVLPGFNDLATIYPDLVEEWHPTRNNMLPTEISSSSSQKVWWKCKKGHEWQATVNNRKNGSGCPVCKKEKCPRGRLFHEIHPDLLTEWEAQLNPNIDILKVAVMSNKTAVWKCQHGHTWSASFANRHKGSGCPYCSYKKILAGYNDLKTTHPDLAQEWNIQKNQPLTPEQISAGSNRKVWWQCKYGHEWEATINNRSKGTGCPVCTGKVVSIGFNDLQTIAPEIAAEWHPTKNKDLLPTQITKAYGSPVWWMCKAGHEWKATVGNRLKGTDCPVCTGTVVQAGVNDLQTLYPHIAKEWNYEKNSPLMPEEVTAYSGLTVWWKCEHGHEWQANIRNRSRGRGCPICSNKQVLPGFNDIATTHPEIAAEWHPTKNGELLPCHVTKGTHLAVWWKCKLGHEWKTTVMHRTAGTGCPICSSDLRVSFPEKAVLYYLKKTFRGVEENYHADWLGRFELDIAIPELAIGIEYDGEAWHTNEERDLRKDQLCRQYGYTLIRIREKGCPNIDTPSIIYQLEQNKKDLPKAIQFVANQIIDRLGMSSMVLDIDVERDRSEISKLIGTGEYEDIGL